jgi:Flp pilus assembly protein TadG
VQVDEGASERGAAVADFALVSALVVAVFLAVLQLGLAVHTRNTLISCASEGARYGARADSTPEAGAERARQLIAASLPDRYAGEVTATTSTADGVGVVVVSVRAPLPVFGALGPDGALHVVGRAYLEEQ